MKLDALFFTFLFLTLVGCQPTERELLSKAEQEFLNQHAEASKYLFLQVVQQHSWKDDVRLRALSGLAEVLLTQTFEYPLAIKTIEQILQEFGNDPARRSETLPWRLRLAQVWRDNLQRPDLALNGIRPLLNQETDLTASQLREVGKTLLAHRDFQDAEKFFKSAWNVSKEIKNCGLSRALQLDLVQTYSLHSKCDQALIWTETSMPFDCKSDRFAVNFEKANCLEVMGEPQKAIKIFEEMIKQDPSNARAHLFLEGIQKRQREKATR